jgi:hypothetical protein
MGSCRILHDTHLSWPIGWEPVRIISKSHNFLFGTTELACLFLFNRAVSLAWVLKAYYSTTHALSPSGVLAAFLASWSWVKERLMVWSMDAASSTSGHWNYSNDWNCDNASIGGGKSITLRSTEYNPSRFYDKEEDSHCILHEVLWIAKLHLKWYQLYNSVDAMITITSTLLLLIFPWLAKEVRV